MVAGALLITMVPLAMAAETLPADKAGTIGQPAGRLAFVRDKNIWVMNADGSDQQMISEVGNADGRPSWSHDGRQIMFTRSGLVNLQAPEIFPIC